MLREAAVDFLELRLELGERFVETVSFVEGEEGLLGCGPVFSVAAHHPARGVARERGATQAAA